MTSNPYPHRLPHPQEFILDPECSCHSLVPPRSVFMVLAHLGISQQAGSKAGLLLPYTPRLWRKRQCSGVV